MYKDVAVEAVQLVTALTHHDVRVLQIRGHVLLTSVAVKSDIFLFVSQEPMYSFPAIIADKFVKLIFIYFAR
jgi:hypothetical protein